MTYGQQFREEYRMALNIGGIYSDGKCPLCGEKYLDDYKSALRCVSHPHHIAGRLKVKIRGTTARFSDYGEARRYLEAVRKSIDTKSWRKKEKTLGDVVEKFLDWKQDLVKVGQIKTGTFHLYRSRLRRIIDFIGQEKKVGEVQYDHIHTFLYKSEYKPKSISDSYALFKEMVRLAHDLGDWPNPPMLPEYRVDVEKTMTLRKTITKKLQGEVLDQIYEDTWGTQPRLYIGIKFLCTYVNVRPGELLTVNEEDLNRMEGILVIRKHKTGGLPKIIRLLQEDVDLLNSLPTGVHGMPLFRHDRPVQRIQVGARFGQAAFSRAWKRACAKLFITDVDLYGGTRHSSAIALYQDEGLSPEQVKRATGHRSSSSFDRYFRLDIDDIKELHKKASHNKKRLVRRWRGNII